MLLRQSKPRMRARPALARRNPSRVRINVDLPAPFGPSNPTAFPVPETPRRQVIPWRISRRPSLTFRFSSSTTGIILNRGASPLDLPYTLSRSPLRRLAPFAWLASLRSLASSQRASPLDLPYTLSRSPLRRLAPFAWLASLRSLASSQRASPLDLPYTLSRSPL